MMTVEHDLTTELLRAVRVAVINGLEPNDALAAVIAVAGIMVGEVTDPAKRQAYEDHVLRMFPRAVSHASHRLQHGSALQ
jgi:hypothetical protein